MSGLQGTHHRPHRSPDPLFTYCDCFFVISVSENSNDSNRYQGKSAPKIRLEQNPKRINFLTGRSFWFKWTVLNLDFIIPSKNQQVPFLDVKILVFKSLWHHHVEAQICSFSQEGFLSVKCMCSDRRLLMKCRLINLLLWMRANS